MFSLTLFNFFVRSERKWTSLATPANLDPNRCPTLFESNEDIWVVLTYLQLRRRGMRVTFSHGLVPGGINIVDGIHLEAEDIGPEFFLVGCRGDGHYPALCQVVLHQNTLRLPGQSSIYVPQWSQPGLKCRNGARTAVRSIGFFGHAAVNLGREFHDESFRKKLEEKGYELIVNDRDGRPNWHDYSNIDVTLSVRNIPYEHLRLKPANKLINSWHAGTPAIVGPEPAVQALRQSTLDYFEVRRPDEVFEVLALLESQPAIYQRMVAHGKARALEYTDAAVSARWLRALRSIHPCYARWRKLPAREMDRSYAARLRLHAQALRRHERDVHRGYWNSGFERRWWESRVPPL